MHRWWHIRGTRNIERAPRKVYAGEKESDKKYIKFAKGRLPAFYDGAAVKRGSDG